MIIFEPQFLTSCFLFLVFHSQTTFCTKLQHPLGTYATPFLHNLIGSRQTCRLHLVFNNLSSENLAHTQNIAVNLSILPSLIQQKNLDIFKNRGWACEIIFYYLKKEKTQNAVKSITNQLWLDKQEYLNFRRPYDLSNIDTEHLHILLLKRKNNFISSPITVFSKDYSDIKTWNNFAILYISENASDSLTLLLIDQECLIISNARTIKLYPLLRNLSNGPKYVKNSFMKIYFNVLLNKSEEQCLMD